MTVLVHGHMWRESPGEAPVVPSRERRNYTWSTEPGLAPHRMSAGIGINGSRPSPRRFDVALSAEERRRLAELEKSLAQDDPTFTQHFQSESRTQCRSSRSRSRRRSAHPAARVGGVLVGLILLVIGVAVPFASKITGPVVSVAGFVVMFVCVLWGSGLDADRSSGHAGAETSRSRSRNGSAGQGRSGRAQPGKSVKGSRTSFTQRMEDRWQRRSRGEL